MAEEKKTVKKIPTHDAVVSDLAWKYWFPTGVKPGRTIHEHSYESPTVQKWVVPLLPPGVSDLKVVAINIDATHHTNSFTVPIQVERKAGVRVDIWTSHPIGWFLEDRREDVGRVMYAHVPYKATHLPEPWEAKKCKETVFGFLRRLPAFRKYPNEKDPLADQHWCLLLTYTVPVAEASEPKPAKAKPAKKKPDTDDEADAKPKAKPKPAKKAADGASSKASQAPTFTKKAVDTMLTEVVSSFTEEHKESLPNPKLLRDDARKNYPKQRCTVFEFLNAYDLDQAAKGNHPLKQASVPAKSRPKGNQDVQPTDDERDEEEAKKARKKPEVRDECQARTWMRNLSAEAMIRFTDQLYEPSVLLEACESQTEQAYLSTASEVVLALRPFVERVDPKSVVVIQPRCADIYYSIPADAFNQRVSAFDEMVRVSDRFTLRLKALRQLSAARKAEMMFACPQADGPLSGLLRESDLGALEYVTRLELGAVVGMRQPVQWKTAFTVFYQKALEPMQNDEIHLTLEMCTAFFKQVLCTFLRRPSLTVEPADNKAANGKRARDDSSKSKPKAKKPKPSNGKAEVEVDGSDESSDDDEEAEASESDAETSSGEEEEEEEDEEKQLEKRFDDGASEVMHFDQQITNVAKVSMEEAPFARTIQLKRMQEQNDSPSVNVMESNPMINSFFRALCTSLDINGHVSRLRRPDQKTDSSYVFQSRIEPESFLFLSFDPFGPVSNGLVGGHLDAHTCVLISSKEKSQLEQKCELQLRSKPKVQQLLKLMDPKPKPKAKPAAATAAAVSDMEVDD